jgi:hypothetical protein
VVNVADSGDHGDTEQLNRLSTKYDAVSIADHRWWFER